MLKTFVASLPVVGYLANRLYFSGGVCDCKNRLDGKIIIVTGSNTGIGFETSLDLARRGARIILACRNMQAASDAAERLRQQTTNDKIECVQLDLADLASVRKFVDNFKERFDRLDILINNAAIMNCPKQFTNDGFEMQFGVNHLGHFLLTVSLLDLLKKSTCGRIVNVSSIVHEYGEMNWDDLMLEKSYGANTAYRQSKLANVLFTVELANCLKGTNVKAVSLHPGIVRTSLSRYEKEGLGLWAPITRFIVYPIWCILTKNSIEGSQTSIHCAISDDIVSGAYYSDCKEKQLLPKAKDQKSAKRLWDISEKLVGL